MDSTWREQVSIPLLWHRHCGTFQTRPLLPFYTSRTGGLPDLPAPRRLFSLLRRGLGGSGDLVEYLECPNFAWWLDQPWSGCRRLACALVFPSFLLSVAFFTPAYASVRIASTWTFSLQFTGPCSQSPCSQHPLSVSEVGTATTVPFIRSARQAFRAPRTPSQHSFHCGSFLSIVLD